MSVFAGSRSDVDRDARLLGYASLWHCNQQAAILPTSLVGTVLLTQYERGIPLEELVRRVNWLRLEVQSRGFKVVAQHNVTLADSIRMVINEVLGGNDSDLVKRHKNLLLLKLYNPRERLELTVLRNQLLHVFIDEAILCCSIYAAEKVNETGAVTRGALYDLFSWLTLLLSFEFIWEPIPRATVARSRFDYALRILEERDVLLVSQEAPAPTPTRHTSTVSFAGTPEAGALALAKKLEAQHASTGGKPPSMASVADESAFRVPHRASGSKHDDDIISINESPVGGARRGTMMYLFEVFDLYLFMFVFIFVYVYVCIYVYVYVCTFVLCLCLYLYLYMFVCLYLYLFMFVYMFMFVFVYVYFVSL